MSEKLFERVFDALPLTAALLDAQGRVFMANAEWRGFSARNAGDGTRYLGANYLDVCRAADDPEIRKLADALEGLLRGEQDSVEREYPCHSPEEKRWFSMRAIPIGEGSDRCVLVCHLDITARKLAEEEAWRRAAHDDLTGLLRRESFAQRLRQSIDRAERHGNSVAVFFLDLNGFKYLNDTHGHKAGDAYLRSIARRLGEQLRRADSLARWGGDELVFFAEDANAATVDCLRSRIAAVFAEPVVFEGQSLLADTAVGVAVYPDDGQTADAVLGAADRAMYQDKSSSRTDTARKGRDT